MNKTFIQLKPLLTVYKSIDVAIDSACSVVHMRVCVVPHTYIRGPTVNG